MPFIAQHREILLGTIIEPGLHRPRHRPTVPRNVLRPARKARLSAPNNYDYAAQDPINGYDLSGEKCICVPKVVKKTVAVVKNKTKAVVGQAPSTLVNAGLIAVAPQLYVAQKIGTVSAGSCGFLICGSLQLHDGHLYIQTGGGGTRGPSVLWSPGSPTEGLTVSAGACVGTGVGFNGCAGGSWSNGTLFGSFSPTFGFSTTAGAWDGYFTTKKVF